MKMAIHTPIFALLIVPSTAAASSTQTSGPLPTADEVVAKMMERDAQRQSAMTGYTAIRRYVAVNKKRQAEMLVQVTCGSDGAKQFNIISEEGSSAIRKHVFYKLLKEESEASHKATRESTRLTPANYQFQMAGGEDLETGPTYVLVVVPKTANKYLIRGRIWVDARDYSIVRIEGEPARNPSFWVHDVHFVHTYQKVGQFWLAASTRTTSEVRFFGSSELAIENKDYTLNRSNQHDHEQERVARLVQ